MNTKQRIRRCKQVLRRAYNESIQTAWKHLHDGTMELSNKELLLLEPFLDRVTSDLCLLGDHAQAMRLFLTSDYTRIRSYREARGLKAPCSKGLPTQ